MTDSHLIKNGLIRLAPHFFRKNISSTSKKILIKCSYFQFFYRKKIEFQPNKLKEKSLIIKFKVGAAHHLSKIIYQN